MKTALYTIADLGTYSNLKTPQANGILKALGRKVVFCRCYSGTHPDFISYYTSKLIPQINTMIGKSDKTIENMDNQLIIAKDTDKAIFLPYYFPKTLLMNKTEGITTINIATSACGHIYDNLSREEGEKSNTMKYFHSLLSSDYIIAYSQWIKKLLIKEGYRKNNIFLTPLGVDTMRFKPEKKKDNIFRVIMIANFNIMKGLRYLLDAWEELRLPSSELILVGKKTRNIYNQIEFTKSNNIKSIDFTNPVPYLQNSSLFVLPSLSEGFGRSILEAMACGLPILTTENTGALSSIKVVNKKNGFVVPIRDSKAIKKHLEWSYNNQDKLKIMGNESRKMARKLTWSNYSKNIKKILDKI